VDIEEEDSDIMSGLSVISKSDEIIDLRDILNLPHFSLQLSDIMADGREVFDSEQREGITRVFVQLSERELSVEFLFLLVMSGRSEDRKELAREANISCLRDSSGD